MVTLPQITYANPVSKFLVTTLLGKNAAKFLFGAEAGADDQPLNEEIKERVTNFLASLSEEERTYLIISISVGVGSSFVWGGLHPEVIKSLFAIPGEISPDVLQAEVGV